MKSLKGIFFGLFLFLSFVVTFVVVFCSVNFYKMYYKEGFVDSNLTTYIENKMSQYDGGDEAEKFFPEYSELCKFKDLSFEYCDNREKSNFFHEYFSYFCLDIVFEDEYYDSYIGSQKRFTVNWEENQFQIIEEWSSKNNCKAILCNNQQKTIRYILFYGDFEETIDINALIAWNFLGNTG